MSDEYPYPFVAPSLFTVAEVQRGKDEHEARIRLAERDRIIALIEAQITGVPGEEVTDEMWTLIHFGQDLIALIKGENND